MLALFTFVERRESDLWCWISLLMRKVAAGFCQFGGSQIYFVNRFTTKLRIALRLIWLRLVSRLSGELNETRGVCDEERLLEWTNWMNGSQHWIEHNLLITIDLFERAGIARGYRVSGLIRLEIRRTTSFEENVSQKRRDQVAGLLGWLPIYHRWRANAKWHVFLVRTERRLQTADNFNKSLQSSCKQTDRCALLEHWQTRTALHWRWGIVEPMQCACTLTKRWFTFERAKRVV